MTYYPSVDLDKQMMRIMEEEIEPIKRSAGFKPNVIAQPLPEAAIRAGKERGGNALGIDADGPLTSESHSYMASFYTSNLNILLKLKHFR